MSDIIKMIQSEEEFNQCVAHGTVLVDFWASWCGPCRMQLPILDDVAKEFAGKVTVAKVNVEENGALAEKFNISSIPTLLVFHNGQIVQEFSGLQSQSTLTASLNQASSLA